MTRVKSTPSLSVQLEGMDAPELHLQGVNASLLIASAAAGVSLLGIIALDGEETKRREDVKKNG